MRRRNRRLFCRLHARLNANGRFDGRRQGQGYLKVFWGWGYSKASKYAASKNADLADTEGPYVHFRTTVLHEIRSVVPY